MFASVIMEKYIGATLCCVDSPESRGLEPDRDFVSGVKPINKHPKRKLSSPPSSAYYYTHSLHSGLHHHPGMLGDPATIIIIFSSFQMKFIFITKPTTKIINCQIHA